MTAASVIIRCPACRNKVTIPIKFESNLTVGNTMLVELVVDDIDHDCPAAS